MLSYHLGDEVLSYHPGDRVLYYHPGDRVLSYHPGDKVLVVSILPNMADMQMKGGGGSGARCLRPDCRKSTSPLGRRIYIFLSVRACPWRFKDGSKVFLVPGKRVNACHDRGYFWTITAFLCFFRNPLRKGAGEPR